MMQDPRETQPSYPGAPTVPPGYVAPPAYYQAPPMAAPKPGFGSVLARMPRLIFRRVIYGIVVLGRWLRPVLGYLLLSIVFLAVIGWLSFQLWGPKGDTPRDVRVAALQPAATVESFIKGQQSYNADLMWSAYSPTYQSGQLELGASKETLQARADNEKLRGLKYVAYDYIGAVPLDGGGGMYYYSVKLEFQGQQAKLPLVFTLDKDGKIIRVMSPLTDS